MSERAKEEARCRHRWKRYGIWGVVVGVSRCKECGVTSRREDFDTVRITRLPDTGDETKATTGCECGMYSCPDCTPPIDGDDR